MKFAVAPEQKSFFKHNQYIELDGLLNEKSFEILKSGVKKTLALRLNTEESRLDKCTAQQLFTAGHDIWRSQNEVKKAIANNQIGEILYELMDERPIRLGYDLVLPAARYASFSGAEPLHYSKYIETEQTLEKMGSIQGVLGGIIFCLEAPANPIPGWPSTPGSLLVVSNNYMLPLQHLQGYTGALYLAVVYCRDRSVYVVQQNDPHTHSYRQAGYNPGDRLNEKNNPVIYR
ncbi:MAG: hypothetical protein WC222_04245 [Parachlamydiales bacterium]|jgi:hypothetical protein